nr:hypothetical protein [Tanacetum cinerariifolium]
EDRKAAAIPASTSDKTPNVVAATSSKDVPEPRHSVTPKKSIEDHIDKDVIGICTAVTVAATGAAVDEDREAAAIPASTSDKTPNVVAVTSTITPRTTTSPPSETIRTSPSSTAATSFRSPIPASHRRPLYTPQPLISTTPHHRPTIVSPPRHPIVAQPQTPRHHHIQASTAVTTKGCVWFRPQQPRVRWT